MQKIFRFCKYLSISSGYIAGRMGLAIPPVEQYWDMDEQHTSIWYLHILGRFLYYTRIAFAHDEMMKNDDNET